MLGLSEFRSTGANKVWPFNWSFSWFFWFRSNEKHILGGEGRIYNNNARFFYEKNEAQICPKIKNKLRTTEARLQISLRFSGTCQLCTRMFTIVCDAGYFDSNVTESFY